MDVNSGTLQPLNGRNTVEMPKMSDYQLKRNKNPPMTVDYNKAIIGQKSHYSKSGIFSSEETNSLDIQGVKVVGEAQKDRMEKVAEVGKGNHQLFLKGRNVSANFLNLFFD